MRKKKTTIIKMIVKNSTANKVHKASRDRQGNAKSPKTPIRQRRVRRAHLCRKVHTHFHTHTRARARTDTCP